MNENKAQDIGKAERCKIPLQRHVSHVNLHGREFKIDKHYHRLESVDKVPPAIACPYCLNTSFMIGYGEYECIAHCKCGHSMVVYDG